MFSFRARAEKGIARHIDASSVVGTSYFSLVRSEHAHASYPGLFFRPPGFSPYIGWEERRVQGLDYTSLGFIANVRSNKVNFLQYKLEVDKRTLIFVTSL